MCLSTQEALNLCSGKFTGLTMQRSDVSSDAKSVAVDTEFEGLDEREDELITQVLNEEELEVFKKKFESPVVNNNGEFSCVFRSRLFVRWLNDY